ncbi:MAG: hypothetical protein ACQESC_00710 [Nanobdellota archaeon]
MTEQSSFKRETAKICAIHDLITGEYVVEEGWKPNHIDTLYASISRANIMGVIVEKSEPYSFTIDDGTGTILVTDFNQRQQTQQLSVGDPVMVIGRPRLRAKTVFLASEMTNSTQLKTQPGWLTLRKQELQQRQQKSSSKDAVNEQQKQQETTTNHSTSTRQEPASDQNTPQQVKQSGSLTGDDIISAIKEKDNGDGCSIDYLIDKFGESAEDVVHTLITMGEVYEIQPGVIKILE